MKRLLRILFVATYLYSPTALSCTNTEWNSSITEVMAVNQCTVSSCTFSFTESGTGAHLSGTFTRATTGYLVMTINSSSLGTSAGWAYTGSTIYAVEVPGGTFVVQPLIAEDLYNPVIFVSNTCPTSSFRANWIFGHWDPSGGSDVSSSSQPAAGYIDSSGTSSVQLTVRDMYEMTAFGSLGSISLTPTPVACSGGKATINAGTGDRQGTVYYGGASQILLYKTAACHSVFAIPQVNISSMGMLTGNYAGFAYDTKQNSGFDATGASVHQVKIAINSAGCTSGSKCTGVGWTTSQVTDATYMSGGLNIQVNAINSPRTGMFTGVLTDGGTHSGNILCTINRNWKTTANTPPYYNSVFCVAQNPTANSEPMNIFLVSTPQAPGMDTTFNTTGFVQYNPGTTDLPNTVAVQPDNKILVGGYATISSAIKAIITRYNVDGTIDTTFGTSGAVTFNVSGSQGDEVEKLMIASDGRIMAGVYSQVSSGVFKPAVFRFSANGVLDTTYGTSGYWTSTFSGYSDSELLGAVIQPDDKVVWFGSCNSTSVKGYGVCAGRVNTDGTIDTTFGSSGFTYFHPGAGTGGGCGSSAACNVEGWRGKLMSNGKFLIAMGSSTSSTASAIGVVRLNSDGTVDTTFNSAGTYPGANMYTGGTWNDVGYSVDVQSTGKVVVGGIRTRSSSNNTYIWELARFNADGTADSSFGTSGLLTTTISANTSEQVNDVYIQPDDKIVACGSAVNASSKWTAAMARYTSAGVLDTTFNSTGIVTFINGTNNTVCGAVAADGLGRLVGTGYTGSQDFGIFRMWP